MRTEEAQDQLWANSPHVVRAFLDMRPRFEKLAEEVAYILKKSVQASDIEYSAITYRAKTLDSFCEKVVRKAYKEHLKEVTDIAGVRIVFLYLSDRSKLESLIEEEFNIIEKVDKVSKEEPDRFGYGALHYLFTLWKKTSGARYDDLKDLVCEIQVRTILQDSWAVVGYHLSYKQESDVPKELRRKLNALSGLFETADDQFDQLRNYRLSYKDRVRQLISKHKDEFLSSEINLDNLIEFLQWKLPERDVCDEGDIVNLLKEIKDLGYTKLDELDRIISRTYDAIKAYETKYPPSDERTGEAIIYAQVGVVRVALELISDEFLERYTPNVWREKIIQFRHLVKE